MVFHRLDVKALHTWDEALFANRAFYLAFHGEYFTSWQEVDFCEIPHPNTKPPLIGFFQAISFKMLGYNRLALRLPIALLGILTGLGLLIFAKKWSSGYTVGILATVILFSAFGYNHWHVLRTGDHDAALAFWLLGSIVFFWLYRFGKHKNLNLVLFFVFTACAILTKSIMGFLMLPGIGLYALFFMPLKPLLKNPAFYAGFGLMALLVILFYGSMEMKHPGFLQLVWDKEIGGRYTTSIDHHEGPWYFYIDYLTGKGFKPFWILSLIGAWFGIRSTNTALRHASIMLSICVLTYLITISAAQTKLIWYAAPLYPLMALLAAMGMVSVSEKWLYLLAEKLRLKSQSIWLVYLLFLASPIYKIIDRNLTESTEYVFERYELALERLHETHPEISQIKVHTRNSLWYPNLIFVANKFSKIYGVEINLVKPTDRLMAGDLVFGSYHERMERYNLTLIEQYGAKGDIRLWRVDSLKRPE